MFERISIDPKICHGEACIKGTRIPVHLIVRMLANGDTIEELLEDYPSLERGDILACLDYAAALAEEQVTPNEEPCGKPQGINSHITNTTAVTLWQATGNPQVEPKILLDCPPYMTTIFFLFP